MAVYQTCPEQKCTVWDGEAPTPEEVDCCTPIVETLQDLRDFPNTYGYIPETCYIRSNKVRGDTGEGMFVTQTGTFAGEYIDDDGITAVYTGADGSFAAVRAGVMDDLYIGWWGVFDDSVDGTPALQAAIRHFAHTGRGGTIHLPARLRMDSRASTNQSGIMLRGPGNQGPGTNDPLQGCWIRPGGTVGSAVIRFAADLDGNVTRGCGLENVSFWGWDRAVNVLAMLQIEACDEVTITNCTFRDISGPAILFQRCHDGNFREITVTRCGSVGDGNSPIFFDENLDLTDGITKRCNFYGLRVSDHFAGRPAMEMRKGTDNKFFGGSFRQTVDDEFMSGLAFILVSSDRNSFHGMTFDSHVTSSQPKVIIDGADTTMTDCVWLNQSPSGQLLVNGVDFLMTDFSMTAPAGGDPLIVQCDLQGVDAIVSQGVIQNGYPLRIGGDSCSASGITIKQSEYNYSLVINGQRGRASQIHISDGAYDGIIVDGDWSKLIDCYVQGAVEHGIQIRGLQNLVSDCTITGIIDGIGVDVKGDQARVRGCSFLNVGENAISVTGEAALITGNVIESTHHGITIALGSNHNITGNNFVSIGNFNPGIYSGIFVSATAGDSATISSNQFGTLSSVRAINVDPAVGEYLITGNNVKNAGGITANNASNVVEANLV